MELEFLYRLQEMRTLFGDLIMPAISFLGDKGWLFIVTGLILLFIPKTRTCGMCVCLSLAAGFLLGNGVLKNLVQRQRPCWIDREVVLLVANPRDYSFPSGHTLAAFETAVSILCFYKRAGLVFLALACLIAFSRLYLFVHFPSDVLGGALLGSAIAMVICRRFSAFGQEKNGPAAG